jgi:ankyrin repeat protein
MDEAAKALLAAGADLHVSDDAGVRPIHAAADRGHTRMCALLMDSGAERVPYTLT